MSFSRNAPRARTRQEFIEEPNLGIAEGQPVNLKTGHPTNEPFQRQHSAPSPRPKFEDLKRVEEHQATNRPQTNAVGLEFPETPWSKFNKKASSKVFFNLRLNDYYMEILRHLASLDDEASMQRIVKRILLPALEEHASEVEMRP